MDGIAVEIEVEKEFCVVGEVGGLIEACGLGENVAVGIEGLDQEAGFDLFSNSSCDFNGDVARDLSLNGS